MINHRYALVVVCAAIVATTACSSPAQPSGTASIVAPLSQSPANNASLLNSAQPITLVARNAVSTQADAVTYTFEVATDLSFTSKIQTKDGVAEGSGGQTSVKLDTLPAAKDYYWHARAQSGGTTGVFGPAFKFTVGPAFALSTPVQVYPLSGTVATSRPVFTTLNATRQGQTGAVTVTYKFEVANNSAFNPTLVVGTVSEGNSQTTFTPASDLPANVQLFWRVTATDQTNGVSSSPSAVQSFTAANSSVAGQIAAQLGVILWPGQQPTGNNGQAILGDNWEIQTLHHLPTNTFFKSPTLEMIQYFDLFDRGMDPQSAIDWMRSHGYPTAAQWYPPPEKAVLGTSDTFVYIAARDKVVVHGIWDVVLKTE